MYRYVVWFDKFFGLLIKKLPDWVRPIMIAATFIGEPAVVIAAAITVFVVGLIKHRPKLIFAEVFGLAAFGAHTLLKLIIHRKRPDTLFVQHMKIKSYSFPSGHAFGSVVFYGLIAYLLYNRLPHPWNYIILLLFFLLILLIGISRVYLGAHFPSDVLVGWLLGGTSLLLIVKYVNP